MASNILHTCVSYLLVVLLCGFSVAIMQCSQIATKKFKYPFILQYINTIQQIPIYIIIPLWRCCKKHCLRQMNDYSSSSLSYVLNVNEPLEERNNDNTSKLNIIKYDRYNTYVYWHWFIFYTFCGSMSTFAAGIILNIGLQHSTLFTVTALSSSRAVFTLILSVIFLQFPLKLWSITAVIVSCLGIILYAMAISNNEKSDSDYYDGVYGISLVVIANMLFAVNDIICKKANECYNESAMIIGNILYIVCTALVSLPLFIWVLWIPHDIIYDLSVFEWNTVYWIGITGLMLLGIHLTEYIAITLKYPLYITMGLLFVTPIGCIVNTVLHDYEPSYLCILGGMLLLLGFMMLEVIEPSQILCPFCDKVLVNEREDIDWKECDVESHDAVQKYKLMNSLEDEYGYKYNEYAYDKNVLKEYIGSNGQDIFAQHTQNDTYNNLNLSDNKSAILQSDASTIQDTRSYST